MIVFKHLLLSRCTGQFFVTGPATRHIVEILGLGAQAMQVLKPPQQACCPPGTHTGTSISHSLSDISRPGINACLLRRRLPVPEAAVRALLPAEAEPFRVRVSMPSSTVLHASAR